MKLFLSMKVNHVYVWNKMKSFYFGRRLVFSFPCKKFLKVDPSDNFLEGNHHIWIICSRKWACRTLTGWIVAGVAESFLSADWQGKNRIEFPTAILYHTGLLETYTEWCIWKLYSWRIMEQSVDRLTGGSDTISLMHTSIFSQWVVEGRRVK